jgi:hypothetical protein
MERMTRWHLLRLAALLGAAASACAHAPPPPPSAPPTSAFTAEQQRALAGTWVFAGDPVEAAALEVAIQRSVSGIFVLGQGLAAESLRSRASPRAELTLELQGNAVRISAPGEPGEAGTLDGPAVLLTNRFGDQSQTTFRIEDGHLVERGTSSGGAGQTVFAPDPDGRTLHLSRRIESDQLSAPLEVTFTYRRQP